MDAPMSSAVPPSDVPPVQEVQVPMVGGEIIEVIPDEVTPVEVVEIDASSSPSMTIAKTRKESNVDEKVDVDLTAIATGSPTNNTTTTAATAMSTPMGGIASSITKEDKNNKKNEETVAAEVEQTLDLQLEIVRKAESQKSKDETKKSDSAPGGGNSGGNSRGNNENDKDDKADKDDDKKQRATVASLPVADLTSRTTFATAAKANSSPAPAAAAVSSSSASSNVASMTATIVKTEQATNGAGYNVKPMASSGAGSSQSNFIDLAFSSSDESDNEMLNKTGKIFPTTHRKGTSDRIQSASNVVDLSTTTSSSTGVIKSDPDGDNVKAEVLSVASDDTADRYLRLLDSKNSSSYVKSEPVTSEVIDISQDDDPEEILVASTIVGAVMDDPHNVMVGYSGLVRLARSRYSGGATRCASPIVINNVAGKKIGYVLPHQAVPISKLLDRKETFGLWLNCNVRKKDFPVGYVTSTDQWEAVVRFTAMGTSQWGPHTSARKLASELKRAFLPTQLITFHFESTEDSEGPNQITSGPASTSPDGKAQEILVATACLDVVTKEGYKPKEDSSGIVTLVKGRYATREEFLQSAIHVQDLEEEKIGYIPPQQAAPMGKIMDRQKQFSLRLGCAIREKAIGVVSGHVIVVRFYVTGANPIACIANAHVMAKELNNSMLSHYSMNFHTLPRLNGTGVASVAGAADSSDDDDDDGEDLHVATTHLDVVTDKHYKPGGASGAIATLVRNRHKSGVANNPSDLNVENIFGDRVGYVVPYQAIPVAGIMERKKEFGLRLVCTIQQKPFELDKTMFVRKHLPPAMLAKLAKTQLLVNFSVVGATSMERHIKGRLLEMALKESNMFTHPVKFSIPSGNEYEHYFDSDEENDFLYRRSMYDDSDDENDTATGMEVLNFLYGPTAAATASLPSLSSSLGMGMGGTDPLGLGRKIMDMAKKGIPPKVLDLFRTMMMKKYKSAYAMPSIKTESEKIEWEAQAEELDKMFDKQSEEQLKNLPQITFPSDDVLLSKLKDHQKVGLRWMVHMESKKAKVPFYNKTCNNRWFCDITGRSRFGPPPPICGGILADEMGMGKTLQTISLLLAAPPSPQSSNGKKTGASPALKRERSYTNPPHGAPNKKQSTVATKRGSARSKPPPLPPTTASSSAAALRRQTSSSSGSTTKPASTQNNKAVEKIKPNKEFFKKWKVQELRNLLTIKARQAPYGKKDDLIKQCLRALEVGKISPRDLLSPMNDDDGGVGGGSSTTGSAPDNVMSTPNGSKKKNKKPPTPVSATSRKKSKKSIKEEENIIGSTSPDKYGCTLVVCPVSVMANWEHQIEQHVAPGVLRTAVYQGGSRGKILDQIRAGDHNVLLVSYQTLSAEYCQVYGKTKGKGDASGLRVNPLFKRSKYGTIFDVHFHRIVLDEAHMIRSSKTGMFKAACEIDAERKWCLTGTPFVNRASDIGSLLTFLRVEPLGRKDIYKQAISSPLNRGEDIGLTRLRAMIAHVALRRSKVSAKIELVDKQVHLQKIVFAMDCPHKKVYDAIFGSLRIVFSAVLRGGDSLLLKRYACIFERILRLRQACCSAQLVPVIDRRTALGIWEELKKRDKTTDAPLTAKEGLELLEKLRGTFENNKKKKRKKKRKGNGDGDNVDDDDDDDDDAVSLGSADTYSDDEIDDGSAEGDNGNELPECAVCLCEMEESQCRILRTCGHIFCETCISRVVTHSDSDNGSNCPLCRKSFTEGDLINKSTAAAAAGEAAEEANDKKDGEDNNGDRNDNKEVNDESGEFSVGKLNKPPKVLALLDAIRSTMKEDEKGVVFSQFTSFLNLVQDHLKAAGYTYTRIDGTMNPSQRLEAVRSFNSDDPSTPRLILCSLHAAGTGLNLTRGNHAFLMDCWWNQAVENQAMDRVHRIGQTRAVNVTRFVMEGSIEERMVALQEAKSMQAKGAMQKLKPEEIRKTRLADLKGLLMIE